MLTQKLNKYNRDNVIIINALPPEYYGISHIPNSVNLPYTTTFHHRDDLMSWFIKVLEQNYYPTSLLTKVKRNKDHVLNLPVVVYCANPTCDAGHKLSLYLMKLGFVNVFHYMGGMEEYHRLKKKKKINKCRNIQRLI